MLNNPKKVNCNLNLRQKSVEAISTLSCPSSPKLMHGNNTEVVRDQEEMNQRKSDGTG